MAATLVFSMHNNFSQNGALGICTCISLNWARKTLMLARGLKSYAEIGLSDLTMNAQMAKLRRLDSNPSEQCDLVGLEMVGGQVNLNSIDQIPVLVKSTAPYVAIFWTATHTMGYRYASHEKEFFDVEAGLYRAKTTKEITAQMKATINTYGPVIGLLHVKLKS